MLAYISRIEIPNRTKLSIPISLKQEEFQKGKNSEKSVPGSDTGEGSFCSSETTHDRRVTSRIMSSVPAGTSHEQRPTPPKNCSGFESRQECACKLNMTEERRLEQNSSGEKITETKIISPKTVLHSSPGEDNVFRNNFFP